MQSSYIFSFPYSVYPFIIFAHPLTLADEKGHSRTLLINIWKGPCSPCLPAPALRIPMSSSCTSSANLHSPTPASFQSELPPALAPAVQELGHKTAEALNPEE